MLRLGSLLVALLLLAYLLWGPAETEHGVTDPVSTAAAIEKAPPITTGARESGPVEREVLPDESRPEEFEELLESGIEPVESGDCALDLRIFDAHTSQPVASSIQLWRLDVPASSTWSEGDQLQLSSEDPRGVFHLSDLPEGEYRVYSLSARRGASSPPAFRIEGETTEMQLFVDMPQKQRIFLHLYRPDGFPIVPSKTQKLEMRGRGTTYSTLGDPVPDWVRRREPKGPYSLIGVGYGGGYMGTSHRRWRGVTAQEEGIPIGTWVEDDRVTESTINRAFRMDGGLSMQVQIRPQGYSSYAAVFLDPSVLQEKLIFPGGETPRDYTGEFNVSAEAVPLGVRDGLTNAQLEVSEADWWDVPVRIYLDPKDYETVDFTWRPSDGPLPHIELKRKTAPQED